METKVNKSAQKQTQNRKKVPVLALVGIGLLLILGICIAVFSGGGGKDATMEIKTAYLTVAYPKSFKKYLKHESLSDGINATEVFSMVYEDVEAELFRLSVTQEAPEYFEGYLNTEHGLMYVSLSASGVDPSIFAVTSEQEEADQNAEMEALYFAMLDGMTDVLASIKQDAKFSVHRTISENDKQNTALTYWNISLPKDITCEETTEGGIYRAAFHGVIGDKTVKLYTVSLGDTAAASPVGQYEVNGQSQMVSVEIHDLNSLELTEEELSAAYTLVDTVNDVLRVIREDKNFHDQLEPAA